MKLIYDEALAIREKAETDARNKRLWRPVKIFAIITLCVILLAIVTNILSKSNVIHPTYAALSITIAAFFAVVLWILWGIKNEKELLYSANVRYYLATKGKTVKSHYIDRRTGGGPAGYFSWPCLDVWVEGKKKDKCIEIPLRSEGKKKGISEDEVDLVADCWYKPYDPKAKSAE